MIDMHSHTKYSDGTDTIEEYLRKAQSMNLTTVSITDHNTCKAYEELEKMDVKKFYSGNIITGVELNTKVLGIPIEILGYKIDYKKMQELIDKNYITNNERCYIELEKLKEKCIKNNIALSEKFIEEYDPNTMWPSQYLHKIITQNAHNKKYIDEDAWNESKVFYRKYMSNPSTIFFVDMDEYLPDFIQASNMIKQAGGLVFIPHIFEYRDNSEKILQHILDNYKFDGIECFYTTFTKEQTDRLLEICRQRNLLISGGSDYHGKNKVNVELGIGSGDLRVDEKILEDWNRK